MRFGAIAFEMGIVERAVLHPAATGIRRRAEIAHRLEIPTQLRYPGPTQTLQHRAPVADFLVHAFFGQGDFFPGGHKDIIQPHPVRFDFFPRRLKDLGTVFTRLQILCQRRIGRAGTALTPADYRSAAQLQMDRVHPERTEKTQHLVAEFAD